MRTNGTRCRVCDKLLGYRNITGFCLQHKGKNTLTCLCGAKIYYLSQTGKCRKCYDKNFYQVNLDRLRKNSNDYYHLNKEKVNKKRALREKVRWYTDFLFKFKKTLRARFKKAMRENWCQGSFVENLGCSVEEARQHIESLWAPGMTWDNYGSGLGTWQIDHKVAFCTVDLMKPENIKLVGHYSNLQPLWFEDHCKKTIEDKNESLRKN